MTLTNPAQGAPDDSPEDFFTLRLPALYLEHGAETFGAVSEVPVTLAFHVEGAGGGLWTIQLLPGHLGVHAGELEGVAPLATFATPRVDWALTRPRLEAWVERLFERLRHRRGPALREQDFDALRNLQATILMTATGLEVDGEPRDMSARVFLNGYTQQIPESLTVSVPAVDYDAMLRGELRPSKAFADGRLRLGGRIVQGLKLASALARLA